MNPKCPLSSPPSPWLGLFLLSVVSSCPFRSLQPQTGGNPETGGFRDGQRTLFWIVEVDVFVHKEEKPKYSKDDFPCLLLPV